MFDRAHAFLTSGSKAKFLLVLVCSVVAAIDRTSTSRKTFKITIAHEGCFRWKVLFIAHEGCFRRKVLFMPEQWKQK